ncbi:FtsK/SpoIIIE domain-containing protein [Demequina sp. B12]|uniref:FtsK/SpoIIIE domain-containing protein n=1 Tax=Demequina sp. B12 TaxID=2992757 RepID=UPI00237A9ED6|nr:FtsK/SpoIIIE domain-containing protein [Demequina sp. B12]MDE0572345.1 FtsK/SpoIIIE domain-containing protein [Demequina sp. B12]
MTRMRLTAPSANDDAETTDWLVTVDEGTTASDLASAMGLDATTLFTDPEEPLSTTGVLSGTNLTHRRTTTSPGQPRLEVVGGPLAGHTVNLTVDAPVTLGRGINCTIVLDDAYLEPEHARLTLRRHGDTGALQLELAPTGDDACVVNGEAHAPGAPATVVPADVFQWGTHIFRLGIAPPSDADLTQDDVGVRGFNRPSRIVPRGDVPVVTLPGDPPEEQEQTPLPWLSAIVPVVLGVSMAIIFGRAVMLLMAAASPIMVVGSFLTNRKLARKRGERTESSWRDEVQAASDRVDQLVREQRIQTWYDQPDPVVIRDTACLPTARLWERRYDDPDALMIRVGVAQRDLHVRYEGGGASFRDRPHSAGVSPQPFSVNAADGPIGIAGTAHATRLAARAALLSLATLRSPRDCQMVMICDDDPDQWQWTTWLPHLHESTHVGATLGNTDDSRRERLRELASTLHMRRLASAQGVAAGSHIFVVLDGARRYRMLPGMVELLKHGHKHGIYVIALDDDVSRLPEEVATVIDIDHTDAAIARVQTQGEFIARVLLDGASLAVSEEIARSLCGYHHISGIGDDGVMPTSVRFVELMGVDLDSAAPVLDRWARTPRQTYVVMGADADGEVAVDLATAGPHALVAGTTGSGKSEFLQTLIIALAMANRPDALNFVLVDYKGGSAFADCERLPHTVGMVTNLDARETERALASLEAELKRRERVLKDDLNAKDVDTAWAKNPEAAASAGLARLVLVIDEFAELKTELPDFINGLVRIARVGRSLGVHLVLATQRPSGAVTPEMQSNINLRVALRVTDQGDSSDVLGSGEAALISTSTPGRGYIKAGANQAPVAFQSARVAGVRPGTVVERRAVTPAAPLAWDRIGYAPRFPSAAVADDNLDHDDTDLRALVNVVLSAAELAGIPKNPSPWLTPLPATLTLDHFVGQRLPSGSVILGLEDLPDDQRQAPRLWHVADDSHLLIAGGARSGRTTAMRSILLQLIQRFTPQDLHLYAIDYGNGALLPFSTAPHTGAVVPGLDNARITRLLDRILKELTRRQNVLSTAGVSSISEQRANAATPEERLPQIVLAIDGWERASATMGADEMTALRDSIMRIVREGPSAGVALVMTGDRGLPADRIAAAVSSMYVLPLRDVSDYRAAGIMIRELPENLPPGRAMHGPQGAEMQFTCPTPDTSGEAQHRHVNAVVATVAEHWATLDPRHSPMRVDVLPPRIGLSEALALPVRSHCDPAGPVLAVGGDELSQFTIPVGNSQHFMVVGDQGTGKSTALAALCAQFAHGDVPVLAVATRESMLAEVAAAAGVPVVTDPQTDADRLGTPPAGHSVVIIDDADHIRDTPLEQALMLDKGNRTYITSARPGYVATAFAGPVAEGKKAARGLILQPSSSLLGTQILSQSIPKSMVGRGSAGEGALYLDGNYYGVRVPQPESPTTNTQ